MKRLISSILFALLFLPSFAQGWNWELDINDYDPARWLSETVVHASVVGNGSPRGDLLLAAFVDGELRGYLDGVDEKLGKPVYTVRVKGDEADKGKSVEWRVVNKATGEVYEGDDLDMSRPVVWTGETEGRPSQPIVISFGEAVPVSEITTAEGRTLFRQDHNYANPFDLSDCYEVLPAEALHREVTMKMRDYRQGSVYEEDGAWKFVPSYDCHGEVLIDITSVSNPSVKAVLSLTVKVRVESIRTIGPDQIFLEKGEKMDIYYRYRVMPSDADNQAVDYIYDRDIISVSVQGEDVILEALETGQTELLFRSKEDNSITASLMVIVTPENYHFAYEVRKCGDDVLDAYANLSRLRQGIWTSREIVFTSLPLPSAMDASYMECEVEAPEGLPSGWKAADDCSFTQDGTRVVLLFTPRVPGEFTLRPTYGGQPMTDAEGNAIAITLPVSLKAQVPTGWSWYSANVAEDGTRLSKALSDKNALVEARTQQHYLFNDPELGYVAGFRNEAGEYIDDFTLDSRIDHGHFRIKTTETEAFDGRLFASGRYNLLSAEWRLNKGWTWVGNPSIYYCPIEQFEGFGRFDDGDVMKTKTGMASFSEGRWWGSITTIAPGEALAIYRKNGAVMTFDMADFKQRSTSSASAPALAPRERNWEYDSPRFMDNMGIIAEIDGLSALNAYSIGAFVGDECRGEGVLVDSRWFIVAHGEGSELVTLRLLDLTTGEETLLPGAYPFAPLLGSYDSPLRIALPGTEQPSAPAYNLQGQPVTDSYKGIVIKDGKKVIQK